MNLLEHEAKKILSINEIAIPAGQLFSDSFDLPLPVLLKSQVPTGGRGKAGGIRLVTDQTQLQPTVNALLQHEIKGHLPSAVLAEEALSIKKEFYLVLLIDRESMSIQLAAHKDGGMEVESQTDFKKWTIPYGQLHADTLGQELADYYSLPGQTFVLQDLIENLYKCFVDNDAVLIEINPLILTADNKLIAGDCKMILDDAASFRHEWNFTETTKDTNFVTIDPNGNTATIANGAGLAMATVDAAYDVGLKPANFLDIGGGATAETLLEAFHRIMEYKNIQVIVINIFAGITRSDEVAKAIIVAKDQIAQLPPLCIRIAGTNQQEAIHLLKQEGIAIEPSLEKCLETAKGYIC